MILLLILLLIDTPIGTTVDTTMSILLLLLLFILPSMLLVIGRLGAVLSVQRPEVPARGLQVLPQQRQHGHDIRHQVGFVLSIILVVCPCFELASMIMCTSFIASLSESDFKTKCPTI